MPEAAPSAGGLVTGTRPIDVVPAIPGRTERRGDLDVTIGPVRVVMRGPMFPELAHVGGSSFILTAQSVEEGGPRTAIRSDDGGERWKPDPSAMTLEPVGPNTIALSDGATITLGLEARPTNHHRGDYRVDRWESPDGRGFRGPLDSRLSLPPAEFDARARHLFYGNVVELADGALVAGMQGRDGKGRFRCYSARSRDRGATWDDVAVIASMETVDDPHGAIATGWTLHGPCEPSLAICPDDRLLCVMRVVNDDSRPPMAAPSPDYHDLSYTVPGDGLYAALPADRYYVPGPPSAPLIAAWSADGGRTWGRSRPIAPGRGCFPRLARNGPWLALSYGGLAFPRWGNAVTFSRDGGATWTPEVMIGPFLTTGYTDIVRTGSDRLLFVFDCTPPQPWTNHAAHWVGAVTVTIHSRAAGDDRSR